MYKSKKKNSLTQEQIKAIQISQIASLLLETLELYNYLVPYTEFCKNKEYKKMLTKDEFTLAQHLAYKKYCEEVNTVCNLVSVRQNKI